MPSTLRRFAPLAIALFIIWSFLIHFSFGFLMLSTVAVAGACIYQIFVNKSQDVFEDDFSVFDLGNFE